MAEQQLNTHPRFVDITGQTFGYLTPIAYAGKCGKGRNSKWACECVCGKVVEVPSYSLKSGATKSCGCKRSELISASPRNHGLASHTIYVVWRNMKQRCTNPNRIEWDNYGGRGIRVCKRWMNSVVDFLHDVGNRPSDQNEIDRIDNNGGYDCGHCDDCKARGITKCNVHWVTRAANNRNRRNTHLITFDGQTKCLADWAAHLGIDRALLKDRLRAGWTVARAFTTPVRKTRRVSVR